MRSHRMRACTASVLAALAWSAVAGADETVFDFSAPGEDQEGDYAASAGARLVAGEALLALVADPAWYDELMAYRMELTITRSTPMTMPRFTIPLDGAPPELFDLALVDGSDLVVVDPSGSLVTPFWVELFGRIQRQGDLRVVADAVPMGSSTWQVYLGGPGSPGHRIEVFTHASPVGFYAPGDDEASATSDLVLMSFVDSNTVEAGSVSATLDAGESVSIAAGSLAAGSPISATGPVFAAFASVGDAAAPHRLMGYQFVYPMPRYAERFTVLSPESDATVTVTGTAGTLDTFTISAGGSATRDVDVPDMEAATILSDAPVSVVRHSRSTQIYDFIVMSPPATDITGPVLGTCVVAALEDSTTATAYTSDGTSESFSLDALGTHVLATTGSQGSGPAVRIVADRPVMAISYADGDGGDMVTFLPTRWLGTEYVVPFDAQYVFVSAPGPGTRCTLQHGGGTNVRTADTLAPPYAKRLYWGSTTNGANLTAPITLTCDGPVHASAERTANDDEVNLWPLRFYRPREPELGFSWGTPEARYDGSSGTVTTPLFRAPLGVKAWQGFEERGTTAVPEGTSLGYLLSTDGGATWLHHDGDEWVEAPGTGQAMSARRVAEEIGSLPAGGVTLSLMAVLASEAGTDTPVLDEIAVTYLPPGPADRFTFAPVPTVVTTGVPVPLTITAVDADGTRVWGFTDSAILYTEPVSLTLVPATSPDFSSGQAVFDIEFHGEGTVNLVALSGDVTGAVGPIQVVEGAGEAALLEMWGGDGQFGTVGTTLAEPIQVRVLDADGNPVAGVPIAFEVTAGGGGVAPETTFSDADGVASALWTLGPDVGANRALADAGDIEGSPVSFVARADPEDGTGGDGQGAGCGCTLVH